MYADTLETVMSVYVGDYHKTFYELEDSVTELLEYYEGRLEIFGKKQQISDGDIRVRNMRRSAYDSCRDTVKMLDTLGRDLKDPKQLAYFKKKQSDRCEMEVTTKTITQIKLF